MGIRDKPIAPASPWQNGFAERLIGSIRRECLNHIVVSGEAHLRLLAAQTAKPPGANRRLCQRPQDGAALHTASARLSNWQRGVSIQPPARQREHSAGAVTLKPFLRAGRSVPQLRISLDKARRIAANIAKLPELLGKVSRK
jgi:hypothetical protein